MASWVQKDSEQRDALHRGQAWNCAHMWVGGEFFAVLRVEPGALTAQQLISPRSTRIPGSHCLPSSLGCIIVSRGLFRHCCSGGRGRGSEENFSPGHDLAEAVGLELMRADGGWGWGSSHS